jgi:hypothetical protein
MTQVVEDKQADGLVLACQGRQWTVLHAGSGAPVYLTGLRQRRFADQFRSDLLATGVDFTAPASEVARHLGEIRAVCRLWDRRASATCVDPVTGEYYNPYVRYGQFVPSKAQAERIAEAMASYAWS